MEGGVTIRNSRLRKFKGKNRKITNIVKIVAIWYIAIFTCSYLTSNTGAYFNDEDHVNGTITAGTWEVEEPDDGKWDKSSLKFTNNDQKIASCVKTTITTTIKNTGKEMKGTSTFEVYYAENGNPKKGSKIGEGSIGKMASEESSDLSFDVSKPGNYKFKALQRTGHPGKGELWSETITITCNEVKTSDPVNNDDDKSKSDETLKDDQKNETTKPDDKNGNDETKKDNQDKKEDSDDDANKDKNEKQDPKDSTENTDQKQDPNKKDQTTTTEPKEPEPKDGESNTKTDGDK
ncbi:amyloid fiber anchoring/assembly protein TapA [Heyndrickxia vini]|uniref:Amyloid fiber anchoring/assembly protein TapA n=1 Tax=Heyndrickxia vini TaxID=1476025 RepID=A0ABX7E5E1_9BACI|nr:amyloid fiber anchoring/assembly protein TapA [Heyndrickxia vini]